MAERRERCIAAGGTGQDAEEAINRSVAKLTDAGASFVALFIGSKICTKMKDIEIFLGQQFLFDGKKVMCVEGSECNNCIFHRETVNDVDQIQVHNAFGGVSFVMTSMQCGGTDYAGYPNGRVYPFVCDGDTRSDGKDVIFIEL